MHDTRPAHIVHVLHRLDVGGLENGVVNLINRLPPAEFRHSLVCMTSSGAFAGRLERDVPILCLDKREGHDVAVYFRVWRALRELRPDIVHTRNLSALEPQLVAWLAGVPHRIHGEHGRDVHDLDNRRRRYRWLRRLLSPFVQQFTAVSAELARYLVEDCRIPAAKVRRICNGVDTARFAPRPGTERAAHYRDAPFDPRGRCIIGTVGRLQAVKDPLLLVRAWRMLVARRPALRAATALVLCGDGPLRAEIEAELAGHEDAKSVWLAGTREDVPACLAALDVFVLPSLAEGISNTILEAMACALPVVATDVGGNAELVEAGVTGTLVPRADPVPLAAAIENLVDDPALRARQGQAGRARVLARFSLDGMVDEYRATYRALLDGAAVAGGSVPSSDPMRSERR